MAGSGFGGTKIASLTARRLLGSTQEQLSSVFQRLSSGSRINRASDDAASLSMLLSSEASSRIYSRGILNLNDGISLLSIADGALDALVNITTRIKELATSAQSESFTAVQRRAMDNEAQALRQEFSRVVATTQFNNQSLFTGGLTSLSLQAGVGNEGALLLSAGGSRGTGAFSTSVSLGTATDAALVDLNNDGYLDLVTSNNGIFVQMGAADGSFGAATSFSITGGAGIMPTGLLRFGDIDGDGDLDLVTTFDDTEVFVQTVTSMVNNGDGTFSYGASVFDIYYGTGDSLQSFELADLNNDGYAELVYAFDGVAGDRFGVFQGNGSFSFGTSSTLASIASPRDFAIGDINNDGLFDIVGNTSSSAMRIFQQNADGTFSTTSLTDSAGQNGVSLFDLNGDGILDLVTSGSTTLGIRARFGVGNGTFGTSTTLVSGANNHLAFGDINGDGHIDILYTSGTNMVSLANSGSGTFTAVATTSNSATRTLLADANNDSVLDALFVSGGAAQLATGATVGGVHSILNFSLRDIMSAKQAADIVSDKLNALLKHRGEVGAALSRTASAVSATISLRDSLNEAAARIRDIDVASETAEAVRLQVLQDSATATLAHINSNEKLWLTLLAS